MLPVASPGAQRHYHLLVRASESEGCPGCRPNVYHLCCSSVPRKLVLTSGQVTVAEFLSGDFLARPRSPISPFVICVVLVTNSKDAECYCSRLTRAILLLLSSRKGC